jgi:hypothetical protein
MYPCTRDKQPMSAITKRIRVGWDGWTVVDGGECCKGSGRVLGMSVSSKPGADAQEGVGGRQVESEQKDGQEPRPESRKGKDSRLENSGSAESNDEEITVWSWQWRSRLRRLTLRRHGIEP